MSAKASILVGILCLLAGPAMAQEMPEGTSLVIVPTKARGGPNLKGQVRKRIERVLKKEMEVVKFKAYKKAARRAGIKGKKALSSPDNAVAAGTEAGVSHVCFVVGQMERRKVGRRKKKIFFAEVTLVEVASGDIVFSERYELKGRKITGVIGSNMVEDLVNALSTPAAPPEPAADEPPPTEELPPDMPDGPPPPTGEGMMEGEGTLAAADAEMPPEPGSEFGLTEEEPTPVVAALTPPGFGEEPSISISEETPPRARGRVRPFIHVGAGGIALLRDGQLAASGFKPPGYEGPLPGGYLRIDFYPFAMDGRGDLYEGLGLHAEGHYTRIETEIDQTTKETITSDVVGARGGLSFRLVFWDSPTAPDFTLKLGFGFFFFPLKKGAFPGARYMGPYAGGTFTIPFVEQFGLVVGGSVTPLLLLSGKLDGENQRLGTKDSSLAFRAEAGFRLFFDPFEILAVGRFQQYTASYTGTTNLLNSLQQYPNVSLTDRYFGGFVTAGVAF